MGESQGQGAPLLFQQEQGPGKGRSPEEERRASQAGSRQDK